MLEEYNKVKHIFKRPKLHCYFGFWNSPRFVIKIGKWLLEHQDNKDTFKYKVYSWLHDVFWRTDPCLPVWRRGNTIRLFKKNTRYGMNLDTKQYEHTWLPEFEDKLKRWHLSWLKPVYQLPDWFSFYIFKHDMVWKWKYDDVRYEFPPQWTIVLFNISLSLYWSRPNPTEGTWDDLYWEPILNYTYKYKDTLNGKNVDMLSQLIGLSDSMGYWSGLDSDGKYEYTWNVRPEYLRNKEYARILREHQEMKEKEINEKKNKTKCPKCGSRMYKVEDIVLTTDPPQYEYKCIKCDEIKYLTEDIETWRL